MYFWKFLCNSCLSKQRYDEITKGTVFYETRCKVVMCPVVKKIVVYVLWKIDEIVQNDNNIKWSSDDNSNKNAD